MSVKPVKVPSNFILLIVPRRYFCSGSICFVVENCKPYVHVRFNISDEFGELSGHLFGK